MRRRCRRPQWVKALEGRVKPYQRFVSTERLCQIDGLEETIARFDEQIRQACAPFDEAVTLLDLWDGSPIHRGAPVKEFLADGGARQVHLETLPGYAPDLRLAQIETPQ